VNVDETGRHQQAIGVQHLSRGTGDATDLDDAPVGDGDIPGARRPTGAVDDGTRADQQVIHCDAF
jgi:hypothetical protein